MQSIVLAEELQTNPLSGGLGQVQSSMAFVLCLDEKIGSWKAGKREELILGKGKTGAEVWM